MTTDADAFLMGTGGKSAKFEKPGDQVWGIVIHAQVRQQTDFKTKAKKFWDDGNAMMELVVSLASEDRDESDPDDDGVRKLYVRGQMQRAVADAVRKAGAPGIREGGKLFVRYTGDGESKGSLSPPKQYVAKYEAPKPTTSQAEEADLDATPF